MGHAIQWSPGPKWEAARALVLLACKECGRLFLLSRRVGRAPGGGIAWLLSSWGRANTTSTLSGRFRWRRAVIGTTGAKEGASWSLCLAWGAIKGDPGLRRGTSGVGEEQKRRGFGLSLRPVAVLDKVQTAKYLVRWLGCDDL